MAGTPTRTSHANRAMFGIASRIAVALVALAAIGAIASPATTTLQASSSTANAAEAAEPAAAATATFEGTVRLDSRETRPGEFRFQIIETVENISTVIAEGASQAAADGADAAIGFGVATYEAPAIYDYAVTQVPGDAEGVTYDERTFTAHVEVAYDETGALVATVSYPDGTIAFVNTYDDASAQGQAGAEGTGEGDPTQSGLTDADKNRPSDTTMPKTGDDTSFAGVALLAAGGAGLVLAGGTVALALRKRAR